MKITVILLCVGCLLSVSSVYSSSWFERQRSYKPKSLRSESLVRVGKMSDGAELEYFKNEILKPFLRVRVPDTEGNLLVQQHIKSQMSGLGWSIGEDSFDDETPFGEKQFTNIIAVRDPSASRSLTLACHFDSKYFSDFEFIGATDSAVPCAMLIDLARHLNSSLAKNCNKSGLTLQYIFFDGEEAFKQWTDTDSLYGSRHLAAKMEQNLVEVDREVKVSQLETIDLFILLDLVGTESTVFRNFFQKTSKLYERLQKLEMRAAKENLLEPVQNFQNIKTNTYFSGQMSWNRGGIKDDHVPFLQRNVPVIHLISDPFPSVWHTKDDNEAALHYPTINNIGKIMRMFVFEYMHLKIS